MLPFYPCSRRHYHPVWGGAGFTLPGVMTLERAEREGQAWPPGTEALASCPPLRPAHLETVLLASRPSGMHRYLIRPPPPSLPAPHRCSGNLPHTPINQSFSVTRSRLTSSTNKSLPRSSSACPNSLHLLTLTNVILYSRQTMICLSILVCEPQDHPAIYVASSLLSVSFDQALHTMCPTTPNMIPVL